MASRSLGTLTLDLIANIGGFRQGLSQAEREADRRSKQIAARAKDIEKAWGTVGKTIAAGFAGITVGAVFQKFIQESRDAQNEQAQLAAAIRSTGGAAGYTQEQLNGMAQSLASSSIFSDGDINKAQTRLLSYTNVVGEQFPVALQAAIDMSARLGTSLEQSAETIGKALDVPSQGLTALSKQGFRFSEEQKKVIERLEQTGKTAEAQGIILDALQTAYGGAASAARNTFGGAITGLQNQLNSLITGNDGSLDGAVDGINSLTRALDSDETKQAFASLTSALATIIELLAKAGTEFINAGDSLGRGLARLTGNLAPLDELQGRIKDIDAAMRSRLLARSWSDMFATDAELAKARQRAIEQMAVVESAYSGRFYDPRRLGPVPSIADQVAAWGPSVKPSGTTTSTNTGTKKDPFAEAQRFLENLQKQLLKTQELSVAEASLAEIRSGRLGKVSAAQEAEILRISRLIDENKELAEQMEIMRQLAIEEGEAVEKANEAYQNRLNALLDPTPSRVLEKQREDVQFLTEEFEKGILTEQQYLEAVSTRLDLTAEKTEKTKSLAEELGLSFSSAFEDAIVGGKGLSDVLKGLEQDILRIVTRKLVTEPLGNALTGMLGGGSSGGAGGILSGIGGFLRNLLPFDGGGFTGSGPRSGGLDGKGGFVAMLHPNETVVDHTKGQRMGGITINQSFAPGTDRQTVNQAALAAGQMIERSQRNA